VCMNNKSNRKNIPEDWQHRKLVDVCKVNQGLQIPISARHKDATNRRKLYITTQHLNGKSAPEYIEDYAASVVCTKKDILMTRTGNSGIVVTGVEGVFHNNFFKIKPNTLIDRTFLVYNLKSPIVQYKLLKLAGASTIPDLNHGDFYSIDLELPPLLEQKRIVAVLEAWDKYIEGLDCKVEIKKNIKKGLLQRLLTGKKRLKGFSGKWLNVKLGHLCTRIRQKNAEDNGNILTISAQYGLINQQKYFKKRIAADSLHNYYLLEKGDFAYNKSYSNGFPMGAIKRLKNYDKGVVSSLYIVFRARSINPIYLDLYFESGLFVRELSLVAQEGARNHGLLNIGINDFFEIDVHVPVDLKEQEAIATILTKADDEIEVLQRKKALVEAQKKYLLNNLITGDIRTSVDLLEKVKTNG